MNEPKKETHGQHTKTCEEDEQVVTRYQIPHAIVNPTLAVLRMADIRRG